MRARPHPRGSSISEDYQPSVDARTEPASLASPQPPVEAIGRALPSTSTCAESANPIDSASASPAVTENLVQINTLLDAQGEPELPSPSPPQPPAGAIGRALASTSTCVELPNLIDSASGSPAVTESPVQIDTLPRADYCPARRRQRPTSQTKQRAQSI
jgi:hypothetical protein